MAWTSQFLQDTETEGVGTAIATYAPDGGGESVTYSRRVDTTLKGDLDAFVAEAKAKVDESVDAHGKRTAIEDKITTELAKLLG